jgi:secreted trypsin-like serine protease
MKRQIIFGTTVIVLLLLIFILYNNKPFVFTCGKPVITGPVVVGGRETYPGKWPWMAFIRGTYQDSCGCLINNQWILTCAHSRLTAGNSVLLGVYDISKNEPYVQKFLIQKVIPHPQYTRGSELNDICLVKLEKPVKFSSYIIPCCLPQKNDLLQNQNLYVAGWGLTEDSIISSTLLEGTLSLVNDTICKSIFSQFQGAPQQICAGNYFISQSDCRGDSGSPIVQFNGNHYVAIGIVSYGKTLCGNLTPSVYTNIQNYIDWIYSNVTS